MLKRLLILSFIALVLGIATNACFILYLNPDFNFFGKLAKTSESWEQELRLKHPHVYVLAGGSSGRTGIDPQILLDEYQIPLVNGAMGAGYGLAANIAMAWEHIRPHDTLILNIEPEILSGTDTPVLNDYGVKKLFHAYGFGYSQASPSIHWDWKAMLQPFWGDSMSIASYIIKTLTLPENEIYFYEKNARIHRSGWMEVLTKNNYHHRAILTDDVQSLDMFTINPLAKEFLERLRQECLKHQVSCIAMVPRTYIDGSMRAYRLWYALQLTRLGFAVLHDPKIGAITTTNYFTDTANHLNREGSRHHTQQLAESLLNEHFWTEEELIHELKKRGWNDQGRRIPTPAQATPQSSQNK